MSGCRQYGTFALADLFNSAQRAVVLKRRAPAVVKMKGGVFTGPPLDATRQSI
jgi:hypothetical protein